MARYYTSVATPLSPEEAFEYMSDITNFALWDPGVTQVERIAGEGKGVGTAYDVTVKAGTRSVMRYEVVKYDAPRSLQLVSTTAKLKSVDEIRVQPTPTGSVVTYDAELTLLGPLGLMDPVLGILFRRIGDRAAKGLREALGGKRAA